MTAHAEFFATARERYQILLARRKGLSPPWTRDPVLRAWRFCNVHREDDRVTQYMRERIRPFIRTNLGHIRTALVFRWFNRVETVELVRGLMISGVWDARDRTTAYHALRDVSPLVSGAYIINTSSRPGLPKLEGIPSLVEAELDCPHGVNTLGEDHRWGSLQEAHQFLRELPGLGPFMAYEVVTDLRWTPVLSGAEDIDTWASAGPGAARGLQWVYPEWGLLAYSARAGQERMLDMMRGLHGHAQDPANWPSSWPRWEMREVEHWLCEYDKYKRGQRGDKLKRQYNDRAREYEG